MDITPQDIRASNRWKVTSARMRRLHPLCFNPFNMHSWKPADEVHHIIPIVNLLSNPRDRGLIFDKRNLVCLCYRCHRKVEGMNRRGIDTKCLFKDIIRGYKNLCDKRTAIIRQPSFLTSTSDFRGWGVQRICKKTSNGYYCGKMNCSREMMCSNCELREW